MAEFELAIDTVLAHEGGFVDHPDDPGGATNFGISLRFLQREYGLDMDLDDDGDLDADDVRRMTRDQAIAIYQSQWWDRNGYGRIGDQAVANKVFDLAVNMGGKQAHKLLQRACRACGWTLADDGAIGPKTLAAVNAIRSAGLLPALRSEAAGYYRLIAEIHPDWKREFLAGWLNRAYS